MANTEGSLHLGPIYLDDVAIERQKFLDAAALAALPALIQSADDGENADSIALNVWLFADAMLLERDRRRAEGKE